MALQMGYGLYQEQRMKMVMTPELRQAIQILQFSASDLWQYITEQMTENPVLELPDLEAERLNELEKWLNYLQEMPTSRRRGGYSENQKESVFEPYAADTGTLAEELEAQLFEFDLSPAKRKICLYLIYNLDERGYLDLDAVHVCKRFLITEERFEECLGVIQAMDPAGVGARSLSECIEIQLKRAANPNPLAIEIARHHLEDVADGRWRKMEQALGAGLEELQAAVDEIKKCNPRPGAGYTGAPTQYVYPDVYIEKVNDEYVVLMNENDVPHLTVNTYYQQLIRQRDQIGEEVEQYLKNWLQSALWLIKGIEQRRDTVYRVAEAIVAKQKEFFDKGVDYLKPLTLKRIAEEVGLHESTVSRATQHKYMQTPKGLFPFRYFFPSGLTTDSGEDLSQDSVKKKIKQFISGEDKKNPLSDQKIADLLSREGIRISRRTVAKYRDEMGIASSARRKRFL
ncbi:MAG: RNA polymerase factor sigma-54 [Thermoactinomyces sp.]|jgi:RNA polymerase sigma-54 factor